MVLKDLSYMFPAYPILCAFASVLTLLPLPAHWRAGNIATIATGFWTFGVLLIATVDTIAWHGNLRNPYPIWGDIAAAWLAIYGFALACCIFCIQYRLWSIARTKRVLVTPKEKTKQKYMTYFICYGVPILFKVLHYVSQGHRYNVIEDVGPMPTQYLTPVALATIFTLEPLVCIVTAIYSGLTIRLFLQRRKEFDAVLASGSHTNKGRYMRLLCLSAVSISLHLPLALYFLILNFTAFPINTWKSWEDTHSNWMRIAYLNRFLLSTTPTSNVYLSISWWILPVCGFNFFIFFGFGEEAMAQYSSIIGAILKPFGIRYPKDRKRVTIRRTWLDVILGRPGKPVNLTSSMTTSSMPQFVSNPANSRPGAQQVKVSSKGSKNTKSSKSTSTPHKSHNPTETRTTTQTTSIPGRANDLNLDIANLDFLDQAEARKQARISAYTRPGQAAKRQATKAGVAPAGRRRAPSFGSSIGSSDEEEETMPQQQRQSQQPTAGQMQTGPKADEEDSSDAETGSSCSCSTCSCSSCDEDSDGEGEKKNTQDITEARRYSSDGKFAEGSSVTNSEVNEKQPAVRFQDKEGDIESGGEPVLSAGEVYRQEQLKEQPDATEEISF